ncbi:hypothetical protein Tsubulata_041889 [Turnera subulata]|uniref:beta-galactosidase n=1 Tax=Turnera subulata TaxID=218843 RepID=A0A9Q0J745_9ROSI|nr:hypothetical protein Tsubulata_041889 [Turnera subulata]
MDLLVLYLVLLFVSIFFIYSTLYKNRTKAAGSFTLPPGRKGWPFIGETLEFVMAGRGGAPEKFVKDRMSKYSGEVFKTSLLGEDMVVFCGAPWNKFLFSKENKYVTSWWPKSVEKILLSEESIGKSPQKFKDLRDSFLHEFLKPDALQEYIPIMDSMAKQHLQENWVPNKEVKVYPLTKQYSFALACSLFMSIKDPDQLNTVSLLFKEVLDGLYSVPINFPGTTYSRAIKKGKRIREELVGIIKQRRRELLENEVTTKIDDILARLLQVSEFSDNEICDRIVGLLVAAHGTTIALAVIAGEMWPSLIAKAKAGGLDVIQTYVFWNLHEPQPGQYDFSGRRDLVRFIKEVQAQGLYASLRIGPFIQSEWSYGGLPFWLHDIPGIVYRSDNEPFKIENEYGMIEKAYGDQGPRYVKWAAQMAVGLKTGVPWVMCKESDAPDPVINSCNGRVCGSTFVGPNSPNKPSLWTENWTTRYEVFGEDAPVRTAEEIAYQVALFVAAKNGSFINYYMYHGGTNFGRSASAFVKTSYYDKAPLDEYGMISQPKWGHLKELHSAINLCMTPLLTGVKDTVSLGKRQQAYVFTVPSGGCAAFLVNTDTNGATVSFCNSSYDLSPLSISILPDCKTVAYNTAKVSTQYNKRTMARSKVLDGADMWQEFREGIPNYDETTIRADMILEHMNTTKDASDYLWYTFSFQHDSPNVQTMLGVSSLGHVLHAFVNGQAVGSAQGSFGSERFNLTTSISLSNGINNVSLLSAMVGLPDSGAYLERRAAGPNRVMIQDAQSLKDFTNYSWGYQVGLVGEKLQIYTDQGSNKVQWSKFSNGGNPLTWYKILVDSPPGDVPVALNLGSMGKGEAWINGQSIGRYWPSYRSPSGSSQIWYNVPRSFLKPTGNLLVLLEEKGGDPLQVSLDTVSVSQMCSHVSTSHLPPVSSWIGHNQGATQPGKVKGRRPRVQLACPSTSKISRILFASYGTPLGTCESTYSVGGCHLPSSKTIVELACLGRKSCSVPVSVRFFGGDPCPGSQKSLLVVAECK